MIGPPEHHIPLSFVFNLYNPVNEVCQNLLTEPDIYPDLSLDMRKFVIGFSGNEFSIQPFFKIRSG